MPPRRAARAASTASMPLQTIKIKCIKLLKQKLKKHQHPTIYYFTAKKKKKEKHLHKALLDLAVHEIDTKNSTNRKNYKNINKSLSLTLDIGGLVSINIKIIFLYNKSVYIVDFMNMKYGGWTRTQAMEHGLAIIQTQ